MRPLRALAAFLFLIVGVVLGALNPELATVDLGLVQFSAGLGVILLCTLLAGVLVGGTAMAASVILPLRSRRKAALQGPESAVLLPAASSPEA